MAPSGNGLFCFFFSLSFYPGRRREGGAPVGRGLRCGRKRVARLMRAARLSGIYRRRWRQASPAAPVHDDLVRRRFVAEAPDRLWLTDITEHPTREGKLYCCVVLDAFSRRVVGWSIDSHQTAALVTNALGMAIEGRSPAPGTQKVRPAGQGLGRTAIDGAPSGAIAAFACG